jgi:glycerophosphoryl diester phosphodiesterase
MRMQRRFRLVVTLTAAAILAAVGAHAATGQKTNDAVTARFSDPSGRIIVVAHRGCHNPLPRRGLGSAPENSLKALEHCVAAGVDVMETDVLRAGDGTLVMIHDDSVDRTTNGSGRVATMTYPELRRLRLRENLGGPNSHLTDEHIPTLEEMLVRAKGRILLNLDVKAAIYPEVIEAVIRAGARDWVFVKTETGIETPPLAGMAPYDRVPFMPILLNADGNANLAAILERQAEGKAPIGAELPRMRFDQLPSVVAAAKARHLPLMANTIFEGFIEGPFSDIDALRDPASVWGRLQAAGVTVFQTDEPGALLAWRATLPGKRHE